MKRLLSAVVTIGFSASLLLSPTFAIAPGTDTVRVGLFYGSSALAAPQLQNYEGSGYQAGYYDSGNTFHSLYPIAQQKIAILKDTHYKVAADGTFSEGTSGGNSVVGAYHVQLPQSYDTAAKASQTVQAAGTDAFVCYLGNTYYVRKGQYLSLDAAQIAASTVGGTAVGGSPTGITVVETGTNRILFEYDSNGIFAMAPQGSAPVTWAKGYKYYGNFAYPRKSGGNLSVINYVELEDYVKGVIPYEMNPDWHVQALKAQAVCARSFVENGTNKHASQGFDVCNTTDCQVYRGANRATDNSNLAVNQTAGKTMSYNGKPIVGYYFAADGGATESAANVWGGDYGYLQGVQDPYENTEAAQNGVWSVTLSASEVATKLKAAGHAIGTVANVRVTARTATDNVMAVTVTDTAGKSVTIEKAKTRTVFGLNSQRYTVTGNNDKGNTQKPSDDLGSNILSGIRAAMRGDSLGRSNTGSTPGIASTSFTFSGRGWGHLVGMSQYGAKAMAEQGKTYDEILKFYYTGIAISE